MDESPGRTVKAQTSTAGEDDSLPGGADLVRQLDDGQSHAAYSVFDFPGGLASVVESREQVMQFVSQHCSDEEDQIDILVALQEALANTALHGCGDDPAKRIQCSVVAGRSDITITVRDPGPGFDVASVDHGNYASSTLSHGRGICLIRSLMTEVKFACGGSEIQLRKAIKLG